MADMKTRYMGLEIQNPFIASASPLWKDVDNVKKAQEAGAAAVVLHSLFEEQITSEERELNKYLLQGTEHFAEAITYFPDSADYHFPPDEYVEHIRQMKDAVSIPIIGSLNGVSPGGWIRYARLIEQAGVDALELNIYYLPTDPKLSGGQIEQNYISLTKQVAESIKIPLAVKISPYISSLPWFASEVREAGARGFVIFNRFYQPDLDIEAMEVVPNLRLSNSDELRIRIRWLAILYDAVDIDLAVTGGVHTGEDAVKAVLAGADVVMITSALLRNGIAYLQTIQQQFSAWMQQHEYESIEDMRGAMSQHSVEHPAAFERANYMKVIGSYHSERQKQLSVRSHR
ncbi:MAG: dihydroorotate dehydrogenase-like protein [Chitinispirillaceae bacterium]